jgi:hypothetical protein
MCYVARVSVNGSKINRYFTPGVNCVSSYLKLTKLSIISQHLLLQCASVCICKFMFFVWEGNIKMATKASPCFHLTK